MRHAKTSSILWGAGFCDDSDRLAEIVRTVNDIENLCSKYYVLDDESYGPVAIMYHEDEVPTNRQFWTECGVDESDISDPDDFVPTNPLLDYVADNGGLVRVMCEKRHEWVIADVKKSFAKLTALAESN